MAVAAPITGAPVGAPPFIINGVMPFLDSDAGEYVRAAHAVACLGSANTGDEGKEFYSNSRIVAAGFDAIALLLAHADLIVNKRPEA